MTPLCQLWADCLETLMSPGPYALDRLLGLFTNLLQFLTY